MCACVPAHGPFAACTASVAQLHAGCLTCVYCRLHECTAHYVICVTGHPSTTPSPCNFTAEVPDHAAVSWNLHKTTPYPPFFFLFLTSTSCHTGAQDNSKGGGKGAVWEGAVVPTRVEGALSGLFVEQVRGGAGYEWEG